MSKYTTTVRFICETSAGLLESVGGNAIEEVIEKSLDKVFDFQFPIFDEEYRKVLETKILKHFYTREIGEETVGLWKFRLNTRLNEIMPYYNQLYNSQLLEFNPLYTKDLYRDGNRKGKNNIDSNGKNGVLSYNSYSDTPQGGLTGVDEGKYLTSANKNQSNGNDENHSEINSTDEYLEHVYGYENRDASELLMKYRKTFINIDVMILKDLEVLFMQLW